jgi:hypothetical protein
MCRAPALARACGGELKSAHPAMVKAQVRATVGSWRTVAFSKSHYELWNELMQF